MKRHFKTIYITGRGHSGSTVLSALLGHSQNINDVGELIYPMIRQCGCGKPFAECEFWQQVEAEFVRNTGLEWEASLQLLRDQAHFKRFPQTLVQRKGSAWVKQMLDIERGITTAVLHVAQAEYMLDSSKQPTRGLFLARHTENSGFIHIVRSPDSYVASYIKRLQTGKVNFLRRQFANGIMNPLILFLVIISWITANLQSEMIRLFGSNRMIRVRYEDLTRNPANELYRLARFFDVDLAPVISALAAGERMQICHIIGGNHYMRAEEGFLVEPKVGVHEPLPPFYSWLIRILCWPLMLRYGYPLLTNARPSGLTPVTRG